MDSPLYLEKIKSKNCIIINGNIAPKNDRSTSNATSLKLERIIYHFVPVYLCADD